MNAPAKTAAFLIAVIVLTAMLLAASAQTSKPAPEFTEAYVSHPYDAPPPTTPTETRTNPTGNSEPLPPATFEAITIALLAVIVALLLWIIIKRPRGEAEHE